MRTSISLHMTNKNNWTEVFVFIYKNGSRSYKEKMKWEYLIETKRQMREKQEVHNLLSLDHVTHLCCRHCYYYPVLPLQVPLRTNLLRQWNVAFPDCPCLLIAYEEIDEHPLSYTGVRHIDFSINLCTLRYTLQMVDNILLPNF